MLFGSLWDTGEADRAMWRSPMQVGTSSAWAALWCAGRVLRRRCAHRLLCGWDGAGASWTMAWARLRWLRPLALSSPTLQLQPCLQPGQPGAWLKHWVNSGGGQGERSHFALHAGSCAGRWLWSSGSSHPCRFDHGLCLGLALAGHCLTACWPALVGWLVPRRGASCPRCTRRGSCAAAWREAPARHPSTVRTTARKCGQGDVGRGTERMYGGRGRQV